MPVDSSGRTYALPGTPSGLYQSVASALTLPSLGVPGGGTDASNATVAQQNAQGSRGNYFIPIAVIVIFLALIKYGHTFDKADVQVSDMKIGVHNWIVGGTMAMLFIIVVKVLANKYLSAYTSITDVINVA